MVKYKTAVTPLQTPWGHCSRAANHQYASDLVEDCQQQNTPEKQCAFFNGHAAYAVMLNYYIFQLSRGHAEIVIILKCGHMHLLCLDNIIVQ